MQLRDIGSRLAARFRRAHVGSLRPGLTLDDGTLVVTDNFLKVRIPAGFERNRRVFVRLLDDSSGVVEEPSRAQLFSISCASLAPGASLRDDSVIN